MPPGDSRSHNPLGLLTTAEGRIGVLVGTGVSVGNGVRDGSVTVTVGVSASTVSSVVGVITAVADGLNSAVGDRTTVGSSISDDDIKLIIANEIRAKIRKKIPLAIFTNMTCRASCLATP